MNYKVTFLFLALLMGCQSKTKEIDQKDHNKVLLKEPWTPPPAGEIVAEYKEEIKDNKLAEAFFEVIIRSTPKSNEGIFEIELIFNQNENKSSLELPKWVDGVVLKPVIKKGEKEYQCLIGFEAETEMFHELYMVIVENKDIRMTQTRIYYL